MHRPTLVLLAVLVATATGARADTKKFELVGERLVVPGPVTFEGGKAVLTADAAPVLEHVKAYLKARKKITTLRIEVHSDSQGGDEFNQRLSEARALAIAHALRGMGVDCKRLLPVGFGETRPIASNKTAEGRAQNRRTEFVNAAKSGKAIDGALDGGGVVAGDPCSGDL
jgi:OOP family OmpA-OmpF porin